MSLIDIADTAATRKKRKKAVKKKCRTVKKRVHGRVVKKRVCTKKKVVVRKKGPSAAARAAGHDAAEPQPQFRRCPHRRRRPDGLLRRLRAARPSACSGAPGTARAPGTGRRAVEPWASRAPSRRSLGPSETDARRPRAERRRRLPLEPEDQYAHDHLAWLDRMVRTDQQLVERMALVFHDWFGIRSDDVGPRT